MFGYSKEKFACFITNIEKDVAFATLIDYNGKKSYMEIPKQDLISKKIEFKAGTIFYFIHRTFWIWENVTFVPCKNKEMTREKIVEKMKYYEEKYGDV
jgi:hypothetical protein